MKRKLISISIVTLLFTSMVSSIFNLSIVKGSTSSAFLEPPTTEWGKTYGLSRGDSASSLIQTAPSELWSDDDQDNIPNYLDRPEFAVYRVNVSANIFDLVWNLSIYGVFPTANYSAHDLLSVFHSWGMVNMGVFDVVMPVILDLTLPFNGTDLAWWLSKYGLVNLERISLVEEGMKEFFGSDDHLRVLLAVKYNNTDEWSAETYFVDDVENEVVLYEGGGWVGGNWGGRNHQGGATKESEDAKEKADGIAQKSQDWIEDAYKEIEELMEKMRILEGKRLTGEEQTDLEKEMDKIKSKMKVILEYMDELEALTKKFKGDLDQLKQKFQGLIDASKKKAADVHDRLKGARERFTRAGVVDGKTISEISEIMGKVKQGLRATVRVIKAGLNKLNKAGTLLAVLNNVIGPIKQIVRGQPVDLEKLVSDLIGKGLGYLIGSLINALLGLIPAIGEALILLKVAVFFGLSVKDLIEAFGDPPAPDVHVYNSSGNHILGANYTTGAIERQQPDVGLYFGNTSTAQFALLSRNQMPYNLSLISRSPAQIEYSVVIEDSVTNFTSISTGVLQPYAEASIVIEHRAESPYVSELLTYANFSTKAPLKGQAASIDFSIIDDEGNPVDNATVNARIQEQSLIFSNTGNGDYTLDIPTSDLSEGSYYDVIISAEKTGWAPTLSRHRIGVSVHDGAIVSMRSSKNIVGQGHLLSLSVIAENQGSFLEAFDITAYANATLIGRQQITLGVGGDTAITFNLDTAGFVRGKYTLTAYVEPVQGEIDIADNSYAHARVVLITVPGDINGDGVVNIFDLVSLAIIFGSELTDLSWNPNADLHQDGVIDIFDAVMIALNFGAR